MTSKADWRGEHFIRNVARDGHSHGTFIAKLRGKDTVSHTQRKQHAAVTGHRVRKLEEQK